MPWKETGPVFERYRFIADYLSKCFSVAELARRYGVQRKTLYKWIARHAAAGEEAAGVFSAAVDEPHADQ